MNRLTYKSKLFYGNKYMFDGNFDRICDKLGKLEDIEEELGIDLLTLFNTQQIYWRIKYIDTGEYSEIKKSYRVHYDFTRKRFLVYEEYDDFGFSLDLKDYGKTWALNREELENE